MTFIGTAVITRGPLTARPSSTGSTSAPISGDHILACRRGVRRLRRTLRGWRRWASRWRAGSSSVTAAAAFSTTIAACRPALTPISSPTSMPGSNRARRWHATRPRPARSPMDVRGRPRDVRRSGDRSAARGPPARRPLARAARPHRPRVAAPRRDRAAARPLWHAAASVPIWPRSSWPSNS